MTMLSARLAPNVAYIQLQSQGSSQLLDMARSLSRTAVGRDRTSRRLGGWHISIAHQLHGRRSVPVPQRLRIPTVDGTTEPGRQINLVYKATWLKVNLTGSLPLPAVHPGSTLWLELALAKRAWMVRRTRSPSYKVNTMPRRRGCSIPFSCQAANGSVRRVLLGVSRRPVLDPSMPVPFVPTLRDG